MLVPRAYWFFISLCTNDLTAWAFQHYFGSCKVVLNTMTIMTGTWCGACPERYYNAKKFDLPAFLSLLIDDFNGIGKSLV